jgi:hypothetical protein
VNLIFFFIVAIAFVVAAFGQIFWAGVAFVVAAFGQIFWAGVPEEAPMALLGTAMIDSAKGAVTLALGLVAVIYSFLLQS